MTILVGVFVRNAAIFAGRSFAHRLAAPLLCLGMSLVASAPCAAALVEYDWLAGPSSSGIGSMIFDLGSGTNGANFSVPKASLTSFNFKFSNGDTVTLSGLNAMNVTTNFWTAANGYLTTTATLSKTTLPRYSFAYVPYSISSPNPNGSTATDQDSVPVLQNFGVWKQNSAATSAVPILPALPLLLSGCGVVGYFGHRNGRREALAG